MIESRHCAGLAVALLALTACHAAPPRAVDPAEQTFKAGMIEALHRSIQQADTGKQIGAVLLHVVLDRRSAPLECKATRAPAKYQSKMPPDVPHSDFQALASLVETQCRRAIYPLAPANAQSTEGVVDVIAPLMLMLPSEAQATSTPRRQANARRDYFWKHLLRDQPISSIGTASVYWRANAEGQVDGCLVQLHPHPLRAAEFRLDGDFQARLSNRCMALNLSDLPYFSVDQQGFAEGYSELDYAPWRVGQP